MIAGIDVNSKNIVIAFKRDEKVKFIRIKRYYDNEAKHSILERLIENGIDEVAIENPEIIRKYIEESKFKNREEKRFAINLVSFLEELKSFLEFAKIKVILVDPENTSNVCPYCHEKIYYEDVDLGIVFDYHTVYCPRCNKNFDRDEVASLNILNRAIEVVAWVMKR